MIVLSHDYLTIDMGNYGFERHAIRDILRFDERGGCLTMATTIFIETRVDNVMLYLGRKDRRNFKLKLREVMISN